MQRNIFAAGFVIFILGLFLVLAFWPIFATSAGTLYEDRSGLVYQSYDRGDKVTAHGTITNISTTGFPGWMEDMGFRNVVYVELDDGFAFLIPDRTEIKFSEGDQIYARLTLVEESLVLGWGRIQYWELSGTMGNKQMVNLVFFITLALGAVVTVAGAVKD